MPVDGLFIKHLCVELNTVLSSSKVKKISMIGSSAFIITLYKDKTTYTLKLALKEPLIGVFLTQHQSENVEHSQFLVLLRKHLENSLLVSIKQHQLDRVLLIEFVHFDPILGPKKRLLVFEWMGRHSNLILIDDQMKIIDCFKRIFDNENRILMPKSSFYFFPSDKVESHIIDLNTYHTSKEITAHYMGISSHLAAYLLNNQISDLSSIKLMPTLDNTSKQIYWFNIFEENITHFDTLSDLLDARVKPQTDLHLRHLTFIEKYMKHLSKKLANLEDDLSKNEQLIVYKSYGDLLYSGIHDLKSYTSYIDGIPVQLDPTISINDHAQLFYKTYQKSKRAITYILAQINKVKDDLLLFDSYKTFVNFSNSHDLNDLEKDLITYGFKPKRPLIINKKRQNKVSYTKVNIEDVDILIGKNHIQNDYITHTIASPNDTWFHVKDGSGAHVIVRSEYLNESLIRTASMLAAYFSNQRHSSSIAVNYTLVKHLKKIPKTPGSQVILKKYQTIFIDIIEDDIINIIANSLNY